MGFRNIDMTIAWALSASECLENFSVVVVITPWNSPIAGDAQKVAPALAAGNTVVLKPAEWSSLVALELGRLCQSVGLPDGLIFVLPGKGSVIDPAIVEHPDVCKVSFIGGAITGRQIAVAVVRKLMPVFLELGGKSPTIVLKDADVDHAIKGILYGIFSSSGHSCIAGSRLFLAREIYTSFLEKLVECTKTSASAHQPTIKLKSIRSFPESIGTAS